MLAITELADAPDPSTDSLEVRDSPGKGRGVFAKRAFNPGDLIERAPVIIIHSEEEPTEETTLYHYTFGWGPKRRDSALALGYGGLYNHSYFPNAYYERREKDQCIDFIAKSRINPGDEISVNYNGNPDSQDRLWFDVKTSTGETVPAASSAQAEQMEETLVSISKD